MGEELNIRAWERLENNSKEEKILTSRHLAISLIELVLKMKEMNRKHV